MFSMYNITTTSFFLLIIFTYLIICFFSPLNEFLLYKSYIYFIKNKEKHFQDYFNTNIS